MAGSPQVPTPSLRIEHRYERKMRILGQERQWAEMLVRHHPSLLVQEHPPRYVNNLYLDSCRGDNLLRHVDGVSRRRKVRVRWYGDLGGMLDAPQLEFKNKLSVATSKRVFPLLPITLEELASRDGLLAASEHPDCPECAREPLASLFPTLLNRYKRQYYRTPDGKVRVTIETEMSFHRPDRLRGLSLAVSRDPALVMEIKYGKNAFGEAAAVSNGFPLPLDKNSKYVNGLALVFGTA